MDEKIILHCMTTIFIFLIIPCLISGCSAKIDEETQAEVDEDATHAEEDALQYLSEKYDMDFELKSFEPDIYMLSSDANWFVRSHYNGAWKGEFIVDRETYTIRGDISENKYMDDYQLEEIQAAYTELMQQYFTDACNIDGVTCEARIRNERSSNRSLKRLFSVYYDGTNLYDCLKENGMWIEIDITNAEYSEEFVGSCRNSLADLEKDYEGVNFLLFIIEGEKRKGIYTESENLY